MQTQPVLPCLKACAVASHVVPGTPTVPILSVVCSYASGPPCPCASWSSCMGGCSPCFNQQRSQECHCCKPREDLPLASLLLQASCTPWPGSHRKTGSPATHGQLTPVACMSSTSSFALPSPTYATSTLGSSRLRTVCRMATLGLRLALVLFEGTLIFPHLQLDGSTPPASTQGEATISLQRAPWLHPCN